MDNDFKQIIGGSYAIRQQEVDRRHADDVHNARLRAQMAQQMTPAFQVGEDRAIDKRTTSDFTLANEVIAQGKSILASTEKTNGRKNRIIPEAAYRDPDFVNSPIFKFALDPDLLAIVSSYLGFVPILSTADFWYNPNTDITDGKQKTYSASLFHLDWADNRLLKVFVHCSDVTDTNGPLVLIEPDASTEVRDALNYQYEQRRSTSTDVNAPDGLFVSDEVVTNQLGREARKDVLTGDEGTVYLADTARCFHYGGRNTQTGQPRLMAVLLYLRPGALKFTKSYGDVPPFRHLATPDMSTLSRLVLGDAVD